MDRVLLLRGCLYCLTIGFRSVAFMAITNFLAIYLSIMEYEAHLLHWENVETSLINMEKEQLDYRTSMFEVRGAGSHGRSL